jgi:hypothetical protein
METVLFAYARRRRLFREEVPEDVYRWALGSSLLPVLAFALSIPVAFVLPLLSIAYGSWPSRSSGSGPATGRRPPAATSPEG